jgi:hypothetical protein
MSGRVARCDLGQRPGEGPSAIAPGQVAFVPADLIHEDIDPSIEQLSQGEDALALDAAHDAVADTGCSQEQLALVLREGKGMRRN